MGRRNEDAACLHHVKTLSEAGMACWQLDDASLLTLDGVASDAGEQVVLFEVDTGSGCACLYPLECIHGSCRELSTQLALDFTVILDQAVDGDPAEFVKSFEVPLVRQRRRLCETLALSGGPAGGDWRWGQSALSLGATVVQAHGSPAPCSSCTFRQNAD